MSRQRGANVSPVTYHPLVKLDLLDLACPLQLLQPLGPALFVLCPSLLCFLMLPPLNLESLLLLTP